MFLLILPTACKTTETVIIKPVIMPVEVEIIPSPGKYTFISIDETSHIISNEDLKILIEYVSELKSWGYDGWESVEYFNQQVERLDNIKE